MLDKLLKQNNSKIMSKLIKSYHIFNVWINNEKEVNMLPTECILTIKYFFKIFWYSENVDDSFGTTTLFLLMSPSSNLWSIIDIDNLYN